MPIQAASPVNRRVVMASRPTGEPVVSDFRLEEAPLPAVGDGEVLLQTLFLSLDPYMRGVMNEEDSYVAALDIGGTMPGGTVARVIESRHPDHQEGDLVVANSGWQAYQVRSGRGLRKLDRGMANPQYALGVLGMPGFTAYFGLLDLANPQPGETVVLAASTGAVGSVVGQLAKIRGCRVVGIAGGPVKNAYAVDQLGYDACVDHYDSRMPELLRAECPDGIDVYFENVGGPVFDAVLPLLNLRARIPLCGLIALYNQERLPAGPDRMPMLQMEILEKRLRMQGFIIGDHYVENGVDNTRRWVDGLSQWIDEGRIYYREDITDGLENAPSTFIGMFSGDNFGKTLIRVSS